MKTHPFQAGCAQRSGHCSLRRPVGSKARPRPKPVRSALRCSNGRNSSSTFPSAETAAFVLDLDEHALGAGADPERDGGMRPGELESVLQHVSHDRREDLSVSLDRHSILDGHHGESDATGVCLNVAAGASSSMNSETMNCS